MGMYVAIGTGSDVDVWEVDVEEERALRRQVTVVASVVLPVRLLEMRRIGIGERLGGGYTGSWDPGDSY